jgi:single-stranded DNA-binding protein
MNNIVIITGNIGEKREPKMYSKKDGSTGILLSMPVAVYISQNQTMWCEVVAYDLLADQTYGSMQKGSRVDVIGKLMPNNYESKDGTKNKSFKIIANHIRVFDKKIDKN